MTASAAWGRPTQQASLTTTRVLVPSLWSLRKPTSASLRTWWEQVDWLMPSTSVSAPIEMPACVVATVCGRRTLVGSDRHANHSA
jgi:hypothetical protein